MKDLYQSLYVVFALSNPRRMARILAYYKRENAMLRARAPARMVLTPQERQLLLKYGKPLGRDIRDVITIVHPDTFGRWVREEQTPGPHPLLVLCGRGPTALAIRRLICKLARENDWGYGRIVGELRKLGIHRISVSTVKNILKARGLEPSPTRNGSTWDEFIRRHASTLWQSDFFSQSTVTLRGMRKLYVLVFLHVETRRVYLSSARFHPNEEWVNQQVKDFARQARADGLKIKQVVHDNDAKFSKAVCQTLRSKRIEPIRTAYRVPNMNAFVERFIRSVRQECLHHFIVFGECHLNFLLAEYRAYYHCLRPHQGRENLTPGLTPSERRKFKKTPPNDPNLKRGSIHCEWRLGGLIKHYYRDAA